MIKIYCEMCGKFTQFTIDDISCVLDGKKPFGDVVCSECKYVIATIQADVPGKYEIVKV